MAVALNGRSLMLDEVVRIAEKREKVAVGSSSLKRMAKFRSMLDKRVSGGDIIYGVNTGFGSLSGKVIPARRIKELQLNLVRSHAIGVGEPMPAHVVRAAMAIRLNGMLQGNSAVRPDVATLIMGMLNGGVIPYIPRYGSLGACLPGDSLVYTNPSGPKEISELKLGDTVYSYIGSLEKTRVIDRNGVPNNFRYKFEGDLRTNRVLRVVDSGVQQTFKIQTYTRELVCTENHPFLKLSIDRGAKGERANYRLEWTELKQLETGDLIMAVKKLKDEGSAFPINLPYLKETTPYFTKLLGMIVGDGYVTRDLKGIWIALPPGPERQEYFALIERLSGKKPAEYKDFIVIYSRPLAKLLAAWGMAKKALEKRVPRWVFALPIDQRLAFLEGYQDADATFHDNTVTHKDGHKWHQNMITYASPNANLIRDCRALAISCGMRCGKIRVRTRTRGLWFNGKRLYNYSTPSTCYEFSVMRRGFFPYSFNGKVSVGVTNPHFYFDKIVSIKPDKFQRVFDIEVEGSHNFISEGLVVHNSGDLAPSAHMALTMVGEGKAYIDGKLVDSRRAFRRARLRPIELGAKEGLSLINGTSFTTALACLAVHRGELLLESANASVALTAEALKACSQSFDDRLMRMRKVAGQTLVARRIAAMLKGSKRVRSSPVPQDPYSIRCAPQVHGSAREALDFAEKLVNGELNSVTDNPVFTEEGDILHGGNFHAQPVAMVLDLLAIATAYLGGISLARIHLLLSNSPSAHKFLARDPGLQSGLMVAEYTASALAAENAKEVYPLSTYPANVSGGIEDHASYGVNSGLKAVNVTENVARILAIEMICCSNYDDSFSRELSPFDSKVYRFVRRASPPLTGDRSFSEEIERLADALLAGPIA